MRKQLRVCVLTNQVFVFLVLAALGRAQGTQLDLAQSAHLSAGQGGALKLVRSVEELGSAQSIQLEWDEERDISSLKLTFDGAPTQGAKIEYWFKNWPYQPPQMPSMEDPLDDPWQGRWLEARAKEQCGSSDCSYTFEPLSQTENPRAKNLPGTAYRRTLKVRITYGAGHPSIRSVQAYSGTEARQSIAHVVLADGATQSHGVTGTISIYNGVIQSVEGAKAAHSGSNWTFEQADTRKPIGLHLLSAEPKLAGSNDETVVTVQTSGQGIPEGHVRFSFNVHDLQNGPIVVPALHVRVTGEERPVTKAGARTETVRRRIPEQPEQTYDRAKREVPALDPAHREWGGPLYLPLALDTSWQKFAFELGARVFVDKKGMKAKPPQIERLNWKGDRLTWSFLTGPEAKAPAPETVEIAPQDGYLPIVTQTWHADGLRWTAEAFATSLNGPLSPDDTKRNENTPAVLMLRVTALNDDDGEAKSGMLWLNSDQAEGLKLENRLLISGDGVRAAVSGSAGQIAKLPGGNSPGYRVSFQVDSHGSHSETFKLPLFAKLNSDERSQLAALSYEDQRSAVHQYWRDLATRGAQINVPERAFTDIVRATLMHIHLTAAKDPGTGLVMVGAASYVYDVYENESCYQALLLDALGYSSDAANILKTMLQLQGSKNFPGAHTGSYAGVFHGARISDSVDYTANGYGLDHGTVLWTLAQHYFYTRDRAWFRDAWPHMRKAIDWIEEQRKTTMLKDVDGTKSRAWGLLPASKLEDNDDWANWFAINAYAYAGMNLTAQILQEVGDQTAGEIKQAADQYRQDLRNAVLMATEASPVVRLQDGSYQPYVPTVPMRRFRLFGPMQANYNARYGDPSLKPLLRLGADRDTLCGTVLLLILGVFDVNEPIAEYILNDWEDNETLSNGMGMNVHGMTDNALWFSQGGMVFQANLINPIAVYLKRHEVPAAIRNLYNDFVACHYPGANAFTEEYHQWVHASGPFYKSPDEARFSHRVRDVLVLEDKDELWLGSGIPRRWFESAEGIHIRNAATFFGPVSLDLQPGNAKRTISGKVMLPQRNPAARNWLVVRTPTKEIRTVRINGKAWTEIDRSREAISLPNSAAELNVEVTY
jgi:hypothetical protein